MTEFLNLVLDRFVYGGGQVQVGAGSGGALGFAPGRQALPDDVSLAVLSPDALGAGLSGGHAGLCQSLGVAFDAPAKAQRVEFCGELIAERGAIGFAQKGSKRPIRPR